MHAGVPVSISLVRVHDGLPSFDPLRARTVCCLLRAGRPLAARASSREDKRFLSWKTKPTPECNALIVYMMDVSGSMGDEQKEIVRIETFWIDTWLRSQYKGLVTRYIVHDAAAKEVNEEQFYHLRESGGTMISSAYSYFNKMIDEEYDLEQWNIYGFHFSDGDNWGEVDNQRCLDLVKALLDRSNAFGYGEIQEGGRRSPSTLMSAFGQIRDPHFIGVTITRKEDVYPALKQFFSTRDEAGLAAMAR